MHRVAVLRDAAVEVTRALTRPTALSGFARELTAAVVDVALYPLGVAEGVFDAAVDVLSKSAEPSINTPVVLVHGYGSVKSHWLALHTALNRIGFAHVETLSYNPLTADIPALADRLCAQVDDLIAETGQTHVHLIGHSMGGLVIRYAVEVLGLGDRVTTATTIVTPHGGSRWAHSVDIARTSLTRSAAQMRPGSRVLRTIEAAAEMNAVLGVHHVRWTAFYGNMDAIVAGRSAMIRTPGATNILVRDGGHLSVMFDDRVVSTIVEQLLIAEGHSASEPVTQLRPSA